MLQKNIKQHLIIIFFIIICRDISTFISCYVRVLFTPSILYTANSTRCNCVFTFEMNLKEENSSETINKTLQKLYF